MSEESPKSRLPRWLTPAQLIPLLGLAAAVFVAVVVNVIAARHFRRWDWTRGGLYTLSPATLETLHDLPDTVEIWVLLGQSDPLQLSVKQMLVAYGAETPKLDVHYVDPDKDAVQLLDVRRRFKIEAMRADDGRVVTDASLVVARGEHHWFILPGDLVEVTEAEDVRAKPKEEQALTAAIRNVLVGDKATICLTTGHGEMSINDPGPQGLGGLREILEKDNYKVVEVDAKDPENHEPFKDCTVVMIAGPQAAFTSEEEARLRTYVMTGGSLFAALAPIAAVSDTGLVAPGVASALAPFGIEADEDVVLERDPTKSVHAQLGAFIATAKPHPIAESLVKTDKGRDPPRILLLHPRSLRPIAGGASASVVLTTSDQAIGITNVTGAANWPVPDGPDPTPRDLRGPLAVAMASERPKLTTKSAHGPRAVVFGSASVLQPLNWAAPPSDRGAAFLVENAISWLAARPVILDVPPKQAGLVLRVSDDLRTHVAWYVLLYVPGAVALLGIAVALRRRSTEGRDWGETVRGVPRENPPPGGETS